VHKVYLDDYYIDKFEVTNSLYRACEEAGVCESPKQEFSVLHANYYRDPEFDDYPVIFVDWNMAKTYCEDWRGAQLPTEAQWEKAARGADARKYPWGESVDCYHANFWASGATSACIGDTTAVGSYEIGASEYGVHDMAGNVWEWVNDSYNALYYGSLPDGYKNPTGPVQNLNFIVIRGGGWDSGVNGVRTAYRGYQPHTYYSNNVGFRCAKDANQ
jgi:formylglycine-generating enzyme required for sulfatase activity